MSKTSLLRMALGALEHRDIAKINWMLEWLVRFMAIVAFAIGEGAQINRMLEWPGPRVLFSRCCRVVDNCVADIAIIPDDLAGVAHMLAIMTTKTAR